ncbi:hypothetical protein ACJDU8_19835 [Clostridium sp. WILCCON 0269]|uniref:Uncharacterized protein n=1 Tax=Candidatus Clostridium eludens TaxID=3381663 RepID=A0ABW8SRK7_9CLOT
MNGYLQCLIDQYERKLNKAIGETEKNIYIEIVGSLHKFQKYVQESQKHSQEPSDDIPKKHIAFDFVGTMPGFMEYLKNLKLKEGK